MQNNTHTHTHTHTQPQEYLFWLQSVLHRYAAVRVAGDPPPGRTAATGSVTMRRYPTNGEETNSDTKKKHANAQVTGMRAKNKLTEHKQQQTAQGGDSFREGKGGTHTHTRTTGHAHIKTPTTSKPEASGTPRN
jgi:hypothetical protein